MKRIQSGLTRRGILFFLAAMLTIGAAMPVAAQQQSGDEGIRTLENIQYSFRRVAERVMPSVVEINTVDIVKQQVRRLPFFFGAPQQDPKAQPQEQEFRRQGLGSGIIVRRSGDTVYVLTNGHVAGEAEEISISLSDGRKFNGTLVGTDPRRDLALVRFETRQAVPIATLGDSDSAQVGDWVLAIGNPLGFESTVTAGIVSGIGRRAIPGSDIAEFTDYIQTDASINPGNSGGALANIRGEVIGINTWIAAPGGGSIGLGFAIPINNVKSVIDDIITNGKVEYGWLGISVTDLQETAAKSLEVANRTGAFVSSIYRDSPADRGGLRPGDFITSIDGTTIRDLNHLLLIVGNLAPGRNVPFEVIRGGRPVTLSVRIAAREDEKALAEQAKRLWPGVSVVPVEEQIRAQLNLPRGAGDLIISNVAEGSPAAIAGFRPGDIVQSINGKAVKGIDDFYEAVNAAARGELVFNLYREGNRLILGLAR